MITAALGEDQAADVAAQVPPNQRPYTLYPTPYTLHPNQPQTKDL